MNKKTGKKLFTTANLTRMAILTALSAMLYLVLEIPVIPPMYKLDFSNIPILLGTYAMGLQSGLVILVLKNLIHFSLRGMATTVGIGNLADIVTTAAYLFPAALLYHRNKTRKNAFLGMGLGTLCQTAAAVLINWLIMIPLYHMPMDEIIYYAKKVLPFVQTEAGFYFLACAPFNLLKALIISLVTALMYKPLSPYLHERTR